MIYVIMYVLVGRIQLHGLPKYVMFMHMYCLCEILWTAWPVTLLSVCYVPCFQSFALTLLCIASLLLPSFSMSRYLHASISYVCVQSVICIHAQLCIARPTCESINHAWIMYLWTVYLLRVIHSLMILHLAMQVFGFYPQPTPKNK